MNEGHMRVCSSPEWAEFVETKLIPWAVGENDLGDDVLEVGPGPGLTTDVLRGLVPRLTAVEIDEGLATSLAARLNGTNVEVIHADGTSLPFASDRFSAATLFTMLHHVPTGFLQDKLFAEVQRVLRPGGIVIGTDGTDTVSRREAHLDDIFVPIDPASLSDRLAIAGFTNIAVDVLDDAFRFRAYTSA